MAKYHIVSRCVNCRSVLTSDQIRNNHGVCPICEYDGHRDLANGREGPWFVKVSTTTWHEITLLDKILGRFGYHFKR